jgi:hypothetical protein
MNTLYYIISEAVSPRVNYRNVKKLFNKYIEVESSNIQSFFYNDQEKIMRVRFLSGAEYEYYRVPIRVFMGLLNAPSHGQSFWKLARGIFSYSRLPNWSDEPVETGADVESSYDFSDLDKLTDDELEALANTSLDNI